MGVSMKTANPSSIFMWASSTAVPRGGLLTSSWSWKVKLHDGPQRKEPLTLPYPDRYTGAMELS